VRQELLRTPTAALLVGASHPFYVRLGEKKFEEGVEAICEDFYAGEVGRPGLSPGIFFGCQWWATSKDSERRIGWRASDGLSIRSFVRIAVDESVQEHSRARGPGGCWTWKDIRRWSQWELRVLADKKLLKERRSM